MQFSQFADYHIHTPLCRHAEGNPLDYAKRAIEVGLDEIGFSDHSPMNNDAVSYTHLTLPTILLV